MGDMRGRRKVGEGGRAGRPSLPLKKTDLKKEKGKEGKADILHYFHCWWALVVGLQMSLRSDGSLPIWMGPGSFSGSHVFCHARSACVRQQLCAATAAAINHLLCWFHNITYSTVAGAHLAFAMLP